MDTKEEIIRYIHSEEFDGALLLSGKWGSGKTYLLKQLAENECSDVHFVFVSLFGVETADALDQIIKSGILYSILNADSSTLKTIGGFGKVLSKLAELKNKIPSPVSAVSSVVAVGIKELFDPLFESYLKSQENSKRLVLVFDDFERSKIPESVRIGVINDYVENRKIRTIIVANEDETKTEDYREYKEKVVFFTLLLFPDYRTIISAIIEGYKETEPGYSAFLQDRMSLFYLETAFAESGYDNIRTIKSIIIQFERVFALWISAGHTPDYRLRSILYTFAADMFEEKAGADSSSNAELSKKYKFYGTNKSRLDILHAWVVSGIWNEKYLREEIQMTFFPPAVSDEHKFLYFNGWELDKEIISNAFPTLLQRAYNGELSSSEMVALLKKILFFKSNEVDVLGEYDSRKLLEGWSIYESKLISGSISESQYGALSPFDERRYFDDNEKEIVQRITSLKQNVEFWEKRRTLLKGINQNSLSKDFDFDVSLLGLDNELLKSCISCFSEGSNADRQVVIAALRTISIRRIPSKTERTVTKANLETFVSFLDQFRENTDDPIAELIARKGSQFIKTDCFEQNVGE